MYKSNIKQSAWAKAVIYVTALAFFFSSLSPVTLSFAQETVVLPTPLPQPGAMVSFSQPLNPPVLKGMKVHPEDPLLFDFIIDPGDSTFQEEQFNQESKKLIKYFLASLTVPDSDLWVNLSPYEKDRIIPDSLGQTEMGRDLLNQDYILKQIFASVLYPEEKLGKSFWEKIYTKAQERFGTTEIPVETFNKVWIIPDGAKVYEKDGAVYITASRLKVLLEHDYLAMRQQLGSQEGKKEDQYSQLSAQIMREIVLPELEREVNEGTNFAPLRQIYHSLILATWYKRRMHKNILSQVYVDRNKTSGVHSNDPQMKERIYEQYLKAFKQGVYNYIREEYDPYQNMVIPRKYFSGGFDYTQAPEFQSDGSVPEGPAQGIQIRLQPEGIPPVAGSETIEGAAHKASRGKKPEKVLNFVKGMVDRTVKKAFKGDYDAYYASLSKEHKKENYGQYLDQPLQHLRRLGFTLREIEKMKNRILLVDVPEEVIDRKKIGRVGGLIVRYKEKLFILYPLQHTRPMKKRNMGDLIHEVVEVKARESGLDEKIAHQIALRVEIAFLTGGYSKAKQILDSLLTSHTVEGAIHETFGTDAIFDEESAVAVFNDGPSGKDLRNLWEKLNKLDSAWTQKKIAGMLDISEQHLRDILKEEITSISGMPTGSIEEKARIKQILDEELKEKESIPMALELEKRWDELRKIHPHLTVTDLAKIAGIKRDRIYLLFSKVKTSKPHSATLRSKIKDALDKIEKMETKKPPKGSELKKRWEAINERHPWFTQIEVAKRAKTTPGYVGFILNELKGGNGAVITGESDVLWRIKKQLDEFEASEIPSGGQLKERWDKIQKNHPSLTQVWLAGELSISESYLGDIFGDEKPGTIDTLKKIDAFLKKMEEMEPEVPILGRDVRERYWAVKRNHPWLSRAKLAQRADTTGGTLNHILEEAVDSTQGKTISTQAIKKKLLAALDEIAEEKVAPPAPSGLELKAKYDALAEKYSWLRFSHIRTVVGIKENYLSTIFMQRRNGKYVERPVGPDELRWKIYDALDILEKWGEESKEIRQRRQSLGVSPEVMAQRLAMDVEDYNLMESGMVTENVFKFIEIRSVLSQISNLVSGENHENVDLSLVSPFGAKLLFRMRKIRQMAKVNNDPPVTDHFLLTESEVAAVEAIYQVDAEFLSQDPKEVIGLIKGKKFVRQFSETDGSYVEIANLVGEKIRDDIRRKSFDSLVIGRVFINAGKWYKDSFENFSFPRFLGNRPAYIIYKNGLVVGFFAPQFDGKKAAKIIYHRDIHSGIITSETVEIDGEGSSTIHYVLVHRFKPANMDRYKNVDLKNITIAQDGKLWELSSGDGKGGILEGDLELMFSTRYASQSGRIVEDLAKTGPLICSKFIAEGENFILPMNKERSLDISSVKSGLGASGALTAMTITDGKEVKALTVHYRTEDGSMHHFIGQSPRLAFSREEKYVRPLWYEDVWIDGKIFNGMMEVYKKGPGGKEVLFGKVFLSNLQQVFNAIKVYKREVIVKGFAFDYHGKFSFYGEDISIPMDGSKDQLIYAKIDKATVNNGKVQTLTFKIPSTGETAFARINRDKKERLLGVEANIGTRFFRKKNTIAQGVDQEGRNVYKTFEGAMGPIFRWVARVKFSGVLDNPTFMKTFDEPTPRLIPPFVEGTPYGTVGYRSERFAEQDIKLEFKDGMLAVFHFSNGDIIPAKQLEVKYRGELSVEQQLAFFKIWEGYIRYKIYSEYYRRHHLYKALNLSVQDLYSAGLANVFRYIRNSFHDEEITKGRLVGALNKAVVYLVDSVFREKNKDLPNRIKRFIHKFSALRKQVKGWADLPVERQMELMGTQSEDEYKQVLEAAKLLGEIAVSNVLKNPGDDESSALIDSILSNQSNRPMDISALDEKGLDVSVEEQILVAILSGMAFDQISSVTGASLDEIGSILKKKDRLIEDNPLLAQIAKDLQETYASTLGSLQGAMHQNYGRTGKARILLFLDRTIARHVRKNHKGNYAAFYQTLERKHKAEYAQLLDPILREIEAVGFDSAWLQQVKDRIFLVDVNENYINRVNMGRVGGAFIRYKGKLHILFPLQHIKNLNDNTIGDMIHELTEIMQRENGIDEKPAHENAEKVRLAYLWGGYEAAKAVLQQIHPVSGIEGGMHETKKDASATPGGIDLNTTQLNIDSETGSKEIEFELPVELKGLESSNFTGFTPVIIRTIPIPNLPFYLGIRTDSLPQAQQLTSNF